MEPRGRGIGFTIMVPRQSKMLRNCLQRIFVQLEIVLAPHMPLVALAVRGVLLKVEGILESLVVSCVVRVVVEVLPIFRNRYISFKRGEGRISGTYKSALRGPAQPKGIISQRCSHSQRYHKR